MGSSTSITLRGLIFAGIIFREFFRNSRNLILAKILKTFGFAKFAKIKFFIPYFRRRNFLGQKLSWISRIRPKSGKVSSAKKIRKALPRKFMSAKNINSGHPRKFLSAKFFKICHPRNFLSLEKKIILQLALSNIFFFTK